MNICLLNDSFPPIVDGVVNVVMNYANILSQKEDCSVVVGTPEYPGEDYTKYPYQVIPYPSIDTSTIASGYRAGNPFYLNVVHEFMEQKPNIIHTHCPIASTFLARMIRDGSDAPVVFTYHTKFDIDIQRIIKSKVLQQESIRALVKNIEACDEVWTVSEGAAENLKSLGYSGDYKVVYNGVDFVKGKAEASFVQEVTKEYDLPEDIPVFLFVGRMMEYKGIPMIIDALEILSKEKKDYRMVFIGDGANRKVLEERCKKNGLHTMIQEEDQRTNIEGKKEYTGKVFFLGAMKDREVLRAWNTRSDVFVFPSTFDTNGLVVREAAACGLASILVKDSCCAEGVVDGHNGLLIEETKESLAQMLRNVCEDRNSVHMVGDRAMEELYLSWQDSVSHAYTLYQELLEKKESGLLQLKQSEGGEYLLKQSFEAYQELQRIILQGQEIQEGMLDNMQERRKQMKERLEKIKNNLLP